MHGISHRLAGTHEVDIALVADVRAEIARHWS
jgi:hypothetical protein